MATTYYGDYELFHLHPPPGSRERLPNSDREDLVGAKGDPLPDDEKRSIVNSQNISGIQQFLVAASILGILVAVALAGLGVGGYFAGPANSNSCAGLCSNGKNGTNGTAGTNGT